MTTGLARGPVIPIRSPSSLLPVLLAVLVAVPSAPGLLPSAEATHMEDPTLRPPKEVRDLERRWLTEAFFDLRNATIRVNMTRGEARNLSATMNASFQAWRDDRWRGALTTMLSARVDAAVLRIDERAQRSQDPIQAWLNATDPMASQATREIGVVRQRVRSMANNTTDPVRMEVLLLASTLVADGLENLRVYPRTRELVAGSGNETPSTFLRQLTATAVGARWDARWASDLVDLAAGMENASADHVEVAPDALPEAWSVMERSLDLETPDSPAERGLAKGINSTTDQDEWLLSLAAGRSYAAASRQEELQSALQKGTLQAPELADRLRNLSRDLGPILPLLEDGYRAVLQVSTARQGDAFLRSGEGDARRLTLLVGRHEATRLLSDSLQVLAVEAESGDGVSPPADREIGIPIWGAIVALGGGLVVGAAAARYLGRQDRLP